LLINNENINMKLKNDNLDLSGVTVSFPENKIHFLQDFALWEGIPSRVKFTVKEKGSHDDYWLVADGYGSPDSYGSGMIAVKEKDIKWALAQLLLT